MAKKTQETDTQQPEKLPAEQSAAAPAGTNEPKQEVVDLPIVPGQDEDPLVRLERKIDHLTELTNKNIESLRIFKFNFQQSVLMQSRQSVPTGKG